EFGLCQICREPAGMLNAFGRFCSLRCFNTWKGVEEGEAVVADAVVLDPMIQAALDRIWPEAERLGWSRKRIYNPHFWPHSSESPRGLASILEPFEQPFGGAGKYGDVIGEVTADYIEIVRYRTIQERQDGHVELVIERHSLRFQKGDNGLPPLNRNVEREI